MKIKLLLVAAIALFVTNVSNGQAVYVPPGFYNPVRVPEPYIGYPYNYDRYHPHYTPQLYQPMSSYGHYRGYQANDTFYYQNWQYNYWNYQFRTYPNYQYRYPFAR